MFRTENSPFGVHAPSQEHLRFPAASPIDHGARTHFEYWAVTLALEFFFTGMEKRDRRGMGG